VAFLRDTTNEFDVKEHWNEPREFEDVDVAADNADLGAGKGQPDDTMTGLQDDNTLSFDSHIDLFTSLAAEPGLSHVPDLHQVFDVEPDSELEEDEEWKEKSKGDDNTYIYFPDWKDASLTPVWYKDMEAIRAFNVATIDCAVGHIKVGKWWGIIDRSYRSEQAVMHRMWQPEYKSEDDND